MSAPVRSTFADVYQVNKDSSTYTPVQFTVMLLCSVVLFLTVLIHQTHSASTSSFDFLLEPSKSAYVGRGECLTFRIPENHLVTGELRVDRPDDPHYQVRVLVTGRDGHQPVNLANLVGKTPFSFLSNADKQNEYDVCFRATPRPRQHQPGMPPPPPPPANTPAFRVGVSLTLAPNFFDEHLAAEYKLKPVEGDYIQSEEKMRLVAAEMGTYLKSEERLRDVNESTLEMVTWLSVASIVCMVGIGVWQVYYLKGYFRTKKLI